jgi:FlaG/FlaF family flagellin (archaellin)
MDAVIAIAALVAIVFGLVAMLAVVARTTIVNSSDEAGKAKAKQPAREEEEVRRI